MPTYLSDPSLNDTAAVRFLVGDTDDDERQFSDEEIGWLLTQKGSVYGAAIAACDALIAKYARDVDVRFGPSSESNSQRVKAYQELKKELKRQSLTSGSALPYAGGISKGDKSIVEQNADRVKPSFTRSSFNHPGDASTSETESSFDE